MKGRNLRLFYNFIYFYKSQWKFGTCVFRSYGSYVSKRLYLNQIYKLRETRTWKQQPETKQVKASLITYHWHKTIRGRTTKILITLWKIPECCATLVWKQQNQDPPEETCFPTWWTWSLQFMPAEGTVARGPMDWWCECRSFVSPPRPSLALWFPVIRTSQIYSHPSISFAFQVTLHMKSSEKPNT